MRHKSHQLRNLVLIDDEQIDKILAQPTNSLSLIENLKAKIGVSILLANFELEATTATDASAVNRDVRVNDMVGYPIYISAFPQLADHRARS